MTAPQQSEINDAADRCVAIIMERLKKVIADARAGEPHRKRIEVIAGLLGITEIAGREIVNVETIIILSEIRQRLEARPSFVPLTEKWPDAVVYVPDGKSSRQLTDAEIATLRVEV